MEQENYENNNDRKIESVYSTRVRAGKRRTYFFDVRATRSNDYFLTITESRKRFDNNGYDRHKVFIYKEDFNKFIKAINEAIDFVKTELMPDFDFDAFNHDEPYNPEDANAFDARVTPYVSDDRGIPSPSQEQPVQANTSEARVTTPLPTNSDQETATQETPDDKDPIEITEKKPLEARETKASEGDNLSGEEVDKW
ncbi:MAG: DUF3276 family protein [Sediminibacterium sp.]|jgi:hypothetical protein|nr:MAG: DUF3276 family protein [Sediminibacterium sp.]